MSNIRQPAGGKPRSTLLGRLRMLLPRGFGRVIAETELRGRFTRRAFVLGGGQAGLASLLTWRLYELQVISSPRYQVLAEANRINVQSIPVARGGIGDRFGVVLAESVEDLQAVLIPDLASDLPGLVKHLEKIVILDDAERQKLHELEPRSNRLQPVLVKDGMSWPEFARLNLLAPELPGVEAQSGWLRRYSHGEDLCHVVGFASRSDAPEADHDPALRPPGQMAGKAGVELGLEKILRGIPGTVRREVDARGRVVRQIERVPGQAGQHIVLTIDAETQRFAQMRLKRENWGALVAIDTSSGEILALASSPTFDPALFASGIAPADWQKLQASPGEPMLNKAVHGQYAPGAIFTLVTALAGLRSGAITSQTAVTCTGGIDAGGQHLRCSRMGGHGTVRLQEALVRSCDVFFYEAARLSGSAAIASAARDLGYGVAHDIGLAGVHAGIVPDADWKLKTQSQPWFEADTLSMGIGQGAVIASPLHLAVMTARLASGLALQPRLIRSGNNVAAAAVRPARLPFTEAALEAIRAGMIGAVNDPANGVVAAAMTGMVLAGKFRTPHADDISPSVPNADVTRRLRDHSVFAGFAPADRPRYAVAAVVEHGGSGATAAASLAADVMHDLLARDPGSRPSAHVTTGRPNREG